MYGQFEIFTYSCTTHLLFAFCALHDYNELHIALTRFNIIIRNTPLELTGTDAASGEKVNHLLLIWALIILLR